MLGLGLIGHQAKRFWENLGHKFAEDLSTLQSRQVVLV